MKYGEYIDMLNGVFLSIKLWLFGFSEKSLWIVFVMIWFIFN